jgi:hypothetical protein
MELIEPAKVAAAAREMLNSDGCRGCGVCGHANR